MISDIKTRIYQDTVRRVFSEIATENLLKEYMGSYGLLTISDISPDISLDELARYIHQNNFDSVTGMEQAFTATTYGISRSRCCFAFFAQPEEYLAQTEYNQQISLNIPGIGQYRFRLHFTGISGCSKGQANELYAEDPFLFTPAARLSQRFSTDDCLVL